MIERLEPRDVAAINRQQVKAHATSRAADAGVSGNATDAMAEAGAEALALMYYLMADQWPLSRFTPVQQDRFRRQARAVWAAMVAVREDGV